SARGASSASSQGPARLDQLRPQGVAASVVFTGARPLPQQSGKPGPGEGEPAVGGKSVSEWVKALKDKQAKVRGEAAAALKQLGPKAGAAVPALIELLQDSDPFVRIEAVAALEAIGPAAVPPLVRALAAPNDNTRMGAALTLGQFGDRAKKAVGALQKALADKEPRVRAHAAQALWRIDPKYAAEAVPVLSEALKSGDRHLRLGPRS